MKKVFTLFLALILFASAAAYSYAQNDVFVPLVTGGQEAAEGFVKAAAAFVWSLDADDTAHVDCSSDELHVMTTTVTSLDLHCISNAPVHDPARWHAPTDHEHGDAPPDWVEGFNNQWFGHGLVYGGDEASSPMENTMKHNVFKGFHVARRADNGVLMDFYFRVHAGSNPADRAAQFHSVEIYAREEPTGTVSFWQGHVDCGDPNVEGKRALRRLHGDGRRPRIVTTDRIASQQFGEAPVEQWYCNTWEHGFALAWLISPQTTWFTIDEHLNDPMNMATWDLISPPKQGLGRRVEIIHDPRGTPPRDTWFCMQPRGTITQPSVGHPSECAEGSLPQFLSATMPVIHASASKTFPGGPDVVVPN